jgi:hypothetical protein
MKRKFILLTVLVSVALISFLAIQHATLAQRPDTQQGGARPSGAPGGPGGGRMFGGMMLNQAAPIEASWAQLCFEIGMEGETMTKAMEVYKEAWDKRKEVIKKSESSSGDRQAMQALRPEAEKIYTDLKIKLKDVISSDQMTKLNYWEKKNQEQAQSRRPQEQPANR